MSPDVYRDVSSKGYLSRIGSSIVGAFVGLILFVIAIPIMFWNEGRAVTTYKSLKEGAAAVVSVSADSVDAANEGKLVHLNGDAVAGAPAVDAAFNVSVDALWLSRQVEMYQWIEEKESKTEKKIGGSEETVTTYRYEKNWSDDRVDSSDFEHAEGHDNPSSWPYTSEDFAAEDITVGAFALSSTLVDKLEDFEDIAVGTDQIDEGLRAAFKDHNDGLYLGADPAAPQVGDLRIKFTVVKPGPISIIARQAGEGLEGYQTKAGDVLSLLETGTVGAQEMFKTAVAVNNMLTWIIRIVGFILMFAGLGLVLKPLSVLADVVPFIGNIVGMGTGVVSFIGAALTWLVVLIISWIVVRPLVGIVLAAAAIGLVVMLKKRKAKSAPPPA
ncbi:MAG TPA: TMEM43 family protein [Kiritimatiellia bacterium]|jgi:hypothetical protein